MTDKLQNTNDEINEIKEAFLKAVDRGLDDVKSFEPHLIDILADMLKKRMTSEEYQQFILDILLKKI